ncbi:MAG: hypothetical protein KY459_05555 [Acidobacteria bacterium]|nr:hypothetical protein [Acidobacteriota bacterium]
MIRVVQERSKRPVWIWLLGGCLLLILLAVALVIGAMYWGSGKLASMVEEQSNPEMREQKAKEILGGTSLPPGYHAGFSISMGLVRSARVADHPDGFAEATRGFVYNESIRGGESKVDAYVAGTAGNVLDEMGTRIRTDELLLESTVEVDGRTVPYSVREGEISESDVALPALFTLMTIPCDDDRERWGVWFQRRDSETTVTGSDLEGTVGDPDAISDLLGYFDVCG